MEFYTDNASLLLAKVAEEMERIYWQSKLIDWTWEGTASREASRLQAELAAEYQALAQLSAEASFHVQAIENQIQLSIFTALGGPV